LPYGAPRHGPTYSAPRGCESGISTASPRFANSEGVRMNKDQVKGRIDQAAGKIKEETGDLLDDKQMEQEGRVDKNLGKTQAEYGDAKEKVKDGIDKF
jgi:uncharacterized protein YjbJ (UPF0337 family)